MPQDTSPSRAAADQAEVLIIGAGPAGLMAADHLAGLGHAVTVCDRMPSPARKFLMAGRGGLNLTHSEPIERFLTRYGPAAAALEPAIRAFDPDALRAFALDLGQETFIGSSGRVFPRAMKASPFLRAWLSRLEARGVRLISRLVWDGFAGPGTSRFLAADGSPRLMAARVTLLALGGASWPRLGSTGGWAAPLRSEGVELVPFQPANCGFTVDWPADLVAGFAGTPLKRLAARHRGHTVRGEAVLTRQGLEGGLVYALSSALRDTLAAEGEALLELDLRPDLDADELARRLARPRGKQSRSTFLRKAAGLTPVEQALVRALTPRLEAPEDLAAQIKALPVRLTGTAGMDRAISSAGGVAWSAVAADYSLKVRPDVHVAGEMLDWEAPTGGYLLQACFATGLAAARGMAAALARDTGQAEGTPS
ncbi:BaiN/RdsA family NAD(P)/FAD-dependent oxidoreductase [Pannonibacter tanglangensis]|uniref:TIGR03862 family flavoprotein n=1 Tax=Pannonibacter tanglangensis TaxID=2750084 RepID=A0ABW9ZNC7_9HYPH|nr:TIGR03862 family flavoprotein [Pannonibacter sp. XCT-34]NBN64562.1 TIGR03862 family flavoprotein [Pannonibacter sp. XCT-34]